VAYVVTFLAGIAVALLANYLTWASEIRRRGLEAVLDFYAQTVSVTEEIHQFMGQWGGFKKIDLGYKPEKPNRPEVQAVWEIRGKLYALRGRIDRVGIFLNQDATKLLLEQWNLLWDGFHDSGGEDSKKDLEFRKTMWRLSEQVALIVRARFMSWRGFLKSLMSS
jgi:hypothetical protein